VISISVGNGLSAALVSESLMVRQPDSSPPHRCDHSQQSGIAMDQFPIFAVLQGCVGGFVLNIMNLYQDSRRPKNERTTKDLLYWILFISWPVIGGILVYVYSSSGYKMDGLLAFTTGLTAPTTITALIATTISDKLHGPIEQ
jgi:hypothetical protein